MVDKEPAPKINLEVFSLNILLPLSIVRLYELIFLSIFFKIPGMKFIFFDFIRCKISFCAEKGFPK